MTGTVTFYEAVGGDGSTVSDDAHPDTGLDAGGHRTRFVPALAQVVAVAQRVVERALDAEAAAASAAGAPGTSATSITSIAIPTSFPTNVNFTLQQTGKLFAKGQTLTFADSADATKQFTGVLTAFDSTTGVGTLQAQQSSGTGTLSNWIVSMSAPINGTLTGRVSALEVAAAQETSDRFFFTGEPF